MGATSRNASLPLLRAAKRRLAQDYAPVIAWALLWGVAVLLVQSFALMNTDTSWLLYAAQRMTMGDVPYKDFYETNPPLILWLNVIPAKLAQLSGLPPIGVWVSCVAALAVICVSLAFKESCQTYPNTTQSNIVLAALAQALLCCSLAVFGQREHLLLLFILPYMLQSLRANEPQLTPSHTLIAALAATGFAIKPHYLLLWAANELIRTYSARRPQLLLRPTNRIIAMLVLLYAASIYTFTPAYLHTIIPQLLLTYDAFTASGEGVIAPLLLLLATYLLPLALVPTRNRQILSWVLASAAIVLLQYKGWDNHYYPVLVFGSWLLAHHLGASLGQPANAMRKAVLVAMALILFALPVYRLANSYANQAYQQRYISVMGRYVTDYKAQGKPLMVLCFDLGASFPAMQYLPVTYPFHFQNLWPLPAVLESEQTALSPALTGPKDLVIHTLAADITRYAPALILVDDNKTRIGAVKNFDFIAYFRQNAAFADAWSHYSAAGHMTINGKDAGHTDGSYTIYTRKTH